MWDIIKVLLKMLQIGLATLIFGLPTQAPQPEIHRIHIIHPEIVYAEIVPESPLEPIVKIIPEQIEDILLSEGVPVHAIGTMKEIARCESGMKQFDETGGVLKGRVHSPDWGIFQINTSVHAKVLKNLDMNVAEFKDNVRFAAYLYKQSGFTPWNPSIGCWKKM